MRQETIIFCIIMLVVLASILIAVQYARESVFGSDYDFYGNTPDIIMAQYSCDHDGGDRVITRDIFEKSAELAHKSGMPAQNNDRKDLVVWRTKRNGQMKKRQASSDNAPFDSLRPAFDAMCGAIEQPSGCFRELSSSASSSKQQSSSSVNNKEHQSEASSTQPDWAPALKKQLRLWSPPATAFLQRPTLLCVSLVVDVDRVERALAQYKLWGHNCDDFYIAVQLPTADQTIVHNATTDKQVIRSRVGPIFRKYGVPISKLWLMRPLVSWRILDAVRFDRWQAFRELSRVMQDEDLMHPVYQAEYTFFVRDDTYVIPENLYGFLSSPEVRHVENLGSPMLLGHVLQVPPPQSSQHDDDHGDKHAPKSVEESNNNEADRRIFASLDGGVIWNRITRKLFFNAIRSQDTCAYANTEADDVMLSECFRFYGVNPIDTADTRGSDRQHVLPPEWAMKVGHDPKLIEWYSLFRGRPSLKGVAAISPSSFSFGGLTTVDQMYQLHDVLSEK